MNIYCDDDDGKQKEGLLDFLKRHPGPAPLFTFFFDWFERSPNDRDFFRLAAASFDF